MTQWIVVEDETEEILTPEEASAVGSYNHSYLQINLGALLQMAGNYTVFGELTLDVSGLDLSQFEIKAREGVKPDLCVYPKRGLSRPVDILKMTEMPLTAIEILSPLQGSYEILQKFRVYFALGIQSCWLVDPATEIVAVYTAMDRHQTFHKNEVIDDVLGIRLPLHQLFA